MGTSFFHVSVTLYFHSQHFIGRGNRQRGLSVSRFTARVPRPPTYCFRSTPGIPANHPQFNQGQARVIKVLLKAGAKVDVLDAKTKATALGAAAEARRSDAVTTVTEAGARLRETKFDRHAIHVATLAANLGVVKDLVFAWAGLEVGCPADLHRTPLHLVVAYGIVPVDQYLLRAGAKINVTDDLGFTLLFLLGLVCRERAVRNRSALVRGGYDGREQRREQRARGLLPGHIAIVKELIRHGVLRASPRGTAAWVAFDLLVAPARNWQIEVADVLTKAGVPPVQEGQVRSGPLSVSCSGRRKTPDGSPHSRGVQSYRRARVSRLHAPHPGLGVASSSPRGVSPGLGSSPHHQELLRVRQGRPHEHRRDRPGEGRQEARPKEHVEADRRMTRRVLLRAVVYKAVSLAWPSVVSSKNKSMCQGVAAPLCGGGEGLSWRRKSQSWTQSLSGAVFRYASKSEGKTKRPPKALIGRCHAHC